MIAQRWRRWLANLSLVLGSTFLTLFLGELVLRLFYPQQLGVWHETRDGLAIHRPNSTINFLNHEIQINSLGMRDRERSVEKRNGTFRILLLGDSFMEALHVAFDESFPKLLEDRLRQNGIRGVEVINAAVSGWGTEDELAYLVRYGRALKPDFILIAMTLHNDVSDNLREQFYTLKEGQLQARPVREIPSKEYLALQIKGFIASHSHLFQLWRKYWYRKEIQNTGLRLNRHVANLLSNTKTDTIERGWRLTFQEMAAIQAEGKEIGAKTAVVLIPSSLQLSRGKLVKLMSTNNLSQRGITDREPQDIMINFGTKQGLAIIDLFPAFKEWGEKRNERLYLESDGHWNSTGHRLAADSVVSELLHRGLLKRQSHISGVYCSSLRDKELNDEHHCPQ
jgi:lysophospholipase L1-like esterase